MRTLSPSEYSGIGGRVHKGLPTNTGFNMDEVNSGLIKPAVTLTAIGAGLETGRATP